MKRAQSSYDLILLGAVIVLLGVGSFMVYSSSLVVAFNEFKDDTYFLTRQVSSIGVGLVAMIVLARIDYHRWQRYSLLILLIAVGLLAIVLLPGIGATSYGSSRWIKMPLFQVQPSEVVKIALVLYMADWLAGRGRRVGEFVHTSLPFLTILGVVCFLVVVEPDFGTTVIIALTAVSIFFVAGASLFQFSAGVVLMGGVMWWVMTQSDYRNRRLLIWQDPWQDVQGAGWHTVQTLIALGSGGLTGLGLGASRQKHYWLVNSHTDAIMAIIGEELGLLGCLAVLTLIALIVWRGLQIAYGASDAFGRLLAAGITTQIFWQAAINVAVVTNSAPYTGVPLPFVSFGGSSTVVSLAGIGLLLSVARHRSTVARRELATSPDAGQPRRRGRRLRARPAAEPVLTSIGQLQAPISLEGIARAPNFRGRPRGH